MHMQDPPMHMLTIRLRMKGGVGSAIATLDKKACEGLVWLYAVHPCQSHRLRLRLRLGLRLRLRAKVRLSVMGGLWVG